MSGMTDVALLDWLGRTLHASEGQSREDSQELYRLIADRLRGEAQAEQQAVACPDCGLPVQGGGFYGHCIQCGAKVYALPKRPQPAAPAPVAGGDEFMKREINREFVEAVKQLCRDYSCRQNRPYMADVFAQLDFLPEQLGVTVVENTPVAGDAVDGWQYLAADWLEQQAEEQEKTNAEYPRHAEAYKAWRDRPLELRILAEKVKKAEGTLKRHCPPPSWMFPDDGGAVSKLPESWEGMAQDLRASVGGTHKAIAREECARELRAALAQDRASQAGAAVDTSTNEAWIARAESKLAAKRKMKEVQR